MMARVALALVLATTACGARQAGQGAADAVVVVRAADAAQAEADVYVDGVRVGAIADLRTGIAVSPGAHRVEVRQDGYFSYYQLIDLAAGARLIIQADLAVIVR